MILDNSASKHTRAKIEIRKAVEEDIPETIAMFTARLVDSVEQSHILEGITAKEELTRIMLTTQIEDMYRDGEIWIAGDFQGALTGHYGKGFTVFSLLKTAIRQNALMKRSLSKEDLQQLSANVKKSQGTVNMRWRKEVCGSNNYYYLQLVAVNRSSKGSGVFRQLVEPILLRSEHESIPVLLDTHDKDNIPLYEHFGFELVREHQAKSGAPITQYSMIRRCS